MVSKANLVPRFLDSGTQLENLMQNYFNHDPSDPWTILDRLLEHA